jgi:hypothetical protein
MESLARLIDLCQAAAPAAAAPTGSGGAREVTMLRAELVKAREVTYPVYYMMNLPLGVVASESGGLNLFHSINH